MSQTPTARRLGRPRDLSIEGRVIDEAIKVFGREGWAGFSIEKVAQNSSTGKASIYRRWKTKEELLHAALDQRVILIADFDAGDLRADLISLGNQAIELYLSPASGAVRRLSLEVESAPSLRPFYDEFSRVRYRAARRIVQRGIERGELPSSMSVEFVLHTVWGGASNFAITQTAATIATAHERGRAYVEQLINLVLKDA